MPRSSSRNTTDRPTAPARPAPSLLTDQDLYLFNEGRHTRLYRHLGAHVVDTPAGRGTYFAVWAPNAAQVSVMGSFNEWDPEAHRLSARGVSGIWEGFVRGVTAGATYKYRVVSRDGRYTADKADPVGFRHEVPPATASIVHELDYRWGDRAWMESRGARAALDAPMSIYEVHLGSWRRVPEEHNRWLTYRELAPLLAEHVARLGFTHVELLPVMEHPLYGSWGYQTTGYFAPTSRYGSPQDFMYLIDTLHQHGIGVILDWVPAHFPSDGHALAYFDGTHLYEHADPRQGFHPDWRSLIFNYARHEVRSFLLSSAMFWLDVYHADGLRVDAVASMLYLDYSRREGEWIPNRYGGRENLEAIEFLRQLNTDVYGAYPDIQMIAEESTAWPGVTRPVHLGGLGFGYKWDMGWMHDTLQHLARDPIHRRFHYNELTFRALYQFSEQYILPLSHDEVVHGKGSLLGRMAGDEWQRRANLRLLLANQWAQPGKKLLFMGGEIGQWSEWNHESSVDWHLVHEPGHAGIVRLVEALNRIYREEPALHEHDCDPSGFEWVHCSDPDHGVLAFLRHGRHPEDDVLVVFNATPVPWFNYRFGVPALGFWRELLNTDAVEYGGSGHGNLGGVEAVPVPAHQFGQSVTLVLPPLAALYLRRDRSGGR